MPLPQAPRAATKTTVEPFFTGQWALLSSPPARLYRGSANRRLRSQNCRQNELAKAPATPSATHHAQHRRDLQEPTPLYTPCWLCTWCTGAWCGRTNSGRKKPLIGLVAHRRATEPQFASPLAAPRSKYISCRVKRIVTRDDRNPSGKKKAPRHFCAKCLILKKNSW